MKKSPLSVLMDEKEMTQQEVANALGVSRQAVQRWESGLTIKVDNLKKLAKLFGVSVSYLTGESEREASVASPSVSESVPLGYTRVPVYSAPAGCSPSYCAQEPDFITGFVQIANTFLHTLPGVTGLGRLSIVPSDGDSMQPTIMNRALVLIDGNQNRINRDGIFCIRTVDQLLIKRVQRNIDGTLTLISDNSRYAPVTVTAADMERTEILGRVVYAFNGNAI